MRKFTFWPSYLEGTEQMTHEQRMEYVLALCVYGVYAKEPDFTDPLMLTAWPGARESIDSGIRKAAGGKVGGQKRSKSKSKQDSKVDNSVDNYDESYLESYLSNLDIDVDKDKDVDEGEKSPCFSPPLDDEGIGSGIADPPPQKTFTVKCKNGCKKPDGTDSVMTLDAEAEGLRCSVCGELTVIE